MSFKHFSVNERAQIEAMLACNTTKRRIAEILGYSETAISNEIRRNSSPEGFYSYVYAQEQAERRRKNKTKHKLSDPKIGEYVESKLKQFWTVLNITDKMPEDIGESLSIESIYNYIYAPKNQAKKLWKYLRRAKKKRKKRSSKKKNRNRIVGSISIHKRPAIVETRSRIGDWELDTIIGAKQKGVIGTFVDRSSRYTLIGKMNNKSAAEMARVLREQFAKIPKSKRKTATADNGSEFACHRLSAYELEIEFFFADPYCSWQRGTNENTNGLIRQFLRKGRDLTDVTQEEVDHIATLLNTRPRRCLGNRTPLEVFNSS